MDRSDSILIEFAHDFLGICASYRHIRQHIEQTAVFQHGNAECVCPILRHGDRLNHSEAGIHKRSIGNDCFLGSNSILQCFDRYRNTKYIPCLSIGNNVSVTRRITVYCAASITIGNDVLIGSDVLITDENHGMDPRNHYSDNALLTKSVVIGNNVWIGDKAVILPGVTIGDGVIIGAGSVVTKPIPPFCICAGNPAKVLKIWNSENERWESI